MRFVRFFVPILFGGFLVSLPASASHLVTGNGFGFGVVSPENGTVSKFYAHPYIFVRLDPKKPLSEGIETANFLKAIGWKQRSGQSAPGPDSTGQGSSAHGVSADYEEDSQIIHIRRSDGEGLAFMPFELRRPVLIVSWEPTSAAAQSGEVDVEWNRPVSAQWVVRSPGVEMHVLKFDGIAETLLLIPLGATLPGPANPGQVLATNLSWALISLENENEVAQAADEFNRWRDGLTPRALAEREMVELEHWRAKAAVHFAGEQERHLWRQSEVMLRMAQSREPNRPGRNGNGRIVAALPDGVYFTPWVRDMSYSLVALIRMGHQAEARAGLLAYFNAQPTGKMRAQAGGIDYQISVVRYFGDGAEEPFFTEEGATNIEFDNWGLALWVLGEYMRKFHDPNLLNTATYRALLYPSARDFVVKPLLADLESYGGGEIVAADTSIWEEHQKDKNISRGRRPWPSWAWKTLPRWRGAPATMLPVRMRSSMWLSSATVSRSFHSRRRIAWHA